MTGDAGLRAGDRMALYLRVNTAADAGSSSAIGAQENALRSVAEAKGWRIVKVFKDVAGGVTADRQGLSACLEAAEAGAFDALLVRDLYRISRQPKITLEVLDQLKRAGVRVVCADQPFQLDRVCTSERIATVSLRANVRRAQTRWLSPERRGSCSASS